MKVSNYFKMDGINPRATVQKLQLDENALRVQVPFSMSISGPSQSKKIFYTNMYASYQTFCVNL